VRFAQPQAHQRCAVIAQGSYGAAR
jgi:hypothetical protein